MKKVDLSVVIPLYNEEESLEELFSAVGKALLKTKKSFEILFVDDGSTDNSFQYLRELEKKNSFVRIYSFRRNTGKSHAMMCGFKNARGEFIVTLDADLQDDPENIPTLYQKLIAQDLDLVTGWRAQRKDSSFKKMTSKIFNKTASFIFGIKVNDLNSGLKVLRNHLAQELNLYGGMHRFIPIIAHEMGYSIGELPVVHYPRKYGKSKYKSTKMLTDIPDLISIYFLAKYTRRPLHFFGKVGGFVFGIGVAILIYLSFLHFQGHAIGDRPLLIFGVLFVIAGLQVIFTGLVADLIVNLNFKNHEELPLKYESKN